jgi:hypothetical protein
LNMYRQNIVDAALDLKPELEEFDRTKDRSVLIKALRDRFLIARYDSAALVEKNRLAASEILIGRMPKMSDNMLIKTIETLSQVGAVDMTSITGSGKSPLNAVQQNLGIPSQGGRVSIKGNPVKDTGQLLEALEHIAAHFREKTIELQAEEEEKKTLNGSLR